MWMRWLTFVHNIALILSMHINLELCQIENENTFHESPLAMK